jgi:glycosyltransferase involved in cell wall biosynthesis
VTKNGKRGTVVMMCETDLIGGAEMMIVRLGVALRERGYAVGGIGPDAECRPPGGSPGWLSKSFEDAGLPWRTYNTRRGFDWRLPGRLGGLLSDLGATAVHSHEFGMAVYGTAAAKRLGIPHVITMHGNMTMTDRWTRRAALRWAFARSDATVAVSRHTREHLDHTLGLREGVLTVIPNGVPERRGDRTTGRRVAGAAESEILILGVGSLMPRKGFHLLIEALAALEREGLRQPWRFVVAGAGAERAALDALAKDRNIEQRFALLGSRDDIPDLLAAADVYVMPSIWEGLPLALLEAMFAAKPILASEVGGIPEAIRHEEEGLLTAPGDVSALAAALRRLLTDAGLRERLGTNARERAQREFTLDAMTDAYERLYHARN